MTFQSETPTGRTYTSSDIDEAYAFALRYDGKFVADFRQALLGFYVVIINEK